MASVASIPLLTRDERRYANYFPKLELLLLQVGSQKHIYNNYLVFFA